MIKKTRFKLITFISALIFASIACSVGSGGNGNVNVENNVPDNNSNEANSEVSDTDAAATETDIPETVAPTATIAHVDFPDSPAAISSFLTDRSTKSLASERRSNSDNYSILLLERPFTKEVMDYLPEIDITRSEMYVTSPWVYVTISLEGAQPDDGKNYYAVEIDLNVNGRGDFLIYGMSSNSTDWTTDSVFVYKDQNGDNGGPSPMQGDGDIPALDGYESLIFESGIGNDPDSAWIRVNPENANQMQIAFKYNLIQSDNEFLWGTWAAGQIFDQTLFDYHDHIEINEAGSPVSDSSNYPIKEVSAVDNTCRWSYGFTLLGNEPGACYIPPTVTPVPTPTSTLTPELGTINILVYRDTNGNGSFNAGEFGLSGKNVTLGSGGCNSSGLQSINSGGDGRYAFTGLPAGLYCITVNVPVGCSGYQITTPNKYSVNLVAGGTTGWAFGLIELIC